MLVIERKFDSIELIAQKVLDVRIRSRRQRLRRPVIKGTELLKQRRGISRAPSP